MRLGRSEVPESDGTARRIISGVATIEQQSIGAFGCVASYLLCAHE
jgi:hypothetical protein